MKKFWGFYENESYKIGCNSSAVYVYDKNDNELAKFKDVAYAFNAAIKPNTNTVVVKSTEGKLAVYDLDNLELVKKIVITKIGAQDEGYSFSPDGKHFYNIEKPVSSTRTQLTIYDATDFSVEKVLFEEKTDMFLENIEFDEHTGNCYILGFFRNNDGVFDYAFVGRYEDAEIKNIKKINEDTFDYLLWYKRWELSGFTEKNLEYSPLKKLDHIEKTSIKQVFENN
ncbi:MAG: hypothetical protein E7656_10500 [Ruminococcaceae bacterium]|nr:hypothetical protein [Oscillospiraceae bacterium]